MRYSKHAGVNITNKDHQFELVNDHQEGFPPFFFLSDVISSFKENCMIEQSNNNFDCYNQNYSKCVYMLKMYVFSLFSPKLRRIEPNLYLCVTLFFSCGN